MDIENFIYKTVSGIENGLSKANKKMGKEEVIKSDINFDLFVEPKKDKIIVHDSKTIKENKATLNRIRFTIQFTTKHQTMAEILSEINKTNQN